MKQWFICVCTNKTPDHWQQHTMTRNTGHLDSPALSPNLCLEDTLGVLVLTPDLETHHPSMTSSHQVSALNAHLPAGWWPGSTFTVTCCWPPHLSLLHKGWPVTSLDTTKRSRPFSLSLPFTTTMMANTLHSNQPCVSEPKACRGRLAAWCAYLVNLLSAC